MGSPLNVAGKETGHEEIMVARRSHEVEAATALRLFKVLQIIDAEQKCRTPLRKRISQIPFMHEFRTHARHVVDQLPVIEADLPEGSTQMQVEKEAGRETQRSFRILQRLGELFAVKNLVEGFRIDKKAQQAFPVGVITSQRLEQKLHIAGG